MKVYKIMKELSDNEQNKVFDLEKKIIDYKQDKISADSPEEKERIDNDIEGIRKQIAGIKSASVN